MSAISIQPQPKVFISYRTCDPDLTLARGFKEGLTRFGCSVFLAAESIHWGENWPKRVEEALADCDVFLLLLSAESAMSGMVLEEVRRAKLLRDARTDRKPLILPVRIRYPNNKPLNYDLDGHLARIQQEHWDNEADTARLIQAILGSSVRNLPDDTSDKGSFPGPVDYVATANYPVPVAPPELPEGQLDLESGFYIARPPIEQQCFNAIIKSSCLIRIKAPRQMGKTSLMSRILQKGRSLNYTSIALSFQLADSEVFSSIGSFLQFFASSIALRLNFPEPDFSATKILGAKIQCTTFFERKILPNLSGMLIIGLDEVDLVFEHKVVAADFFGLIRAWHEESKISDLWKKLRLVLVHSTEVYVPLKINQSPFNVGLPITPREFTSSEVTDLAGRHGLPWEDNMTKQVMSTVGGHPYLVRVLMYEIAIARCSLRQCLDEGATDTGVFGDHLRRHLWNVEQFSELGKALLKVVTSQAAMPFTSEVEFKLESMGLVERVSGGIVPRYAIYRNYFRHTLGRLV